MRSANAHTRGTAAEPRAAAEPPVAAEPSVAEPPTTDAPVPATPPGHGTVSGLFRLRDAGVLLPGHALLLPLAPFPPRPGPLSQPVPFECPINARGAWRCALRRSASAHRARACTLRRALPCGARRTELKPRCGR